VALFGRRKPLHERLLEAGGLGDAARRADARPTVGGTREPGVHGIARQREWDALATVEAPELHGDEYAFDVLPDRTVLVEGGEDADEPLAPLADAIERELQPPYRARAVRQSDELWAVAARTIEVVRLPPRFGESLELSVRGDERELVVDGVREFGGIPELQALAEYRHRDYVVRAERLDDDWWEVRIDPL
jgi:hypothetical protein